MTTLTIIGNLTGDPELRYTAGGQPVCTFTVAENQRVKDKNTGEWRAGDPLFMRCTLWGQPGEAFADNARKGMRVIVIGQLKQRDYEDRQGQKRTSLEMNVEEAGTSLKFAGKQGGVHPAQGNPFQHPQGQANPWTAPAGGTDTDPWATPQQQAFDDAPPF